MDTINPPDGAADVSVTVATAEAPGAIVAGLMVNALKTGAVIVKAEVLLPVPPGVVTEIVPVVAPTGTVAISEVDVTDEIDVEATPLKLTKVAPARLVPLIVMALPAKPLVGPNVVTVGNGSVTTKAVGLYAVPVVVVTLILPVVAPVGMIAVSDVGLATTTDVHVKPSTFTTDPVRLVPVTVILVPTGPLAGENDVTVGTGSATTKAVEL